MITTIIMIVSSIIPVLFIICFLFYKHCIRNKCNDKRTFENQKNDSVDYTHLFNQDNDRIVE